MYQATGGSLDNTWKRTMDAIVHQGGLGGAMALVYHEGYLRLTEDAIDPSWNIKGQRLADRRQQTFEIDNRSGIR